MRHVSFFKQIICFLFKFGEFRCQARTSLSDIHRGENTKGKKNYYFANVS